MAKSKSGPPAKASQSKAAPSTAATAKATRPPSTFQVVSLWLTTLLFSASLLKKFQDSRDVDGHPLFGLDRLYPAWLLPAAATQELVMIVLLHVDRPLGVLNCFVFLGGVCHAQASKGGPWDQHGPIALLPLVLAFFLTLMNVTNRCGPVSRALGMRFLRPREFLVLALLCVGVGVTVGFMAARSFRGLDDASAAASAEETARQAASDAKAFDEL